MVGRGGPAEREEWAKESFEEGRAGCTGAGKDRSEEVRAFDLCPFFFDMLTPRFQLQALELLHKAHLDLLAITAPRALISDLNARLPYNQYTSCIPLITYYSISLSSHRACNGILRVARS